MRCLFPLGRKMPVTSKIVGSGLKGIVDCLEFLREANIGKKENLTRETGDGDWWWKHCH